MQLALNRARWAGESLERFQQVYPIVELQIPNNPEQVTHFHEAMTFKTLKELKQATFTCGATATFTLGLTQLIGQQVMTPSDCKEIAQVCLSPEDYLCGRKIFQTAQIGHLQCHSQHSHYERCLLEKVALLHK